MTEYITKEQVLKIIDNVEVDTSYWVITIDGYVTPKPDTFERLHTEINNLPPADVAPVVHAKALNPIELKYCDISIIAATCSNCGKDILVDDSYCSNCSARMDGGERDAD